MIHIRELEGRRLYAPLTLGPIGGFVSRSLDGFGVLLLGKAAVFGVGAFLVAFRQMGSDIPGDGEIWLESPCW